jgi:hypothetical protein
MRKGFPGPFESRINLRRDKEGPPLPWPLRIRIAVLAVIPTLWSRPSEELFPVLLVIYLPRLCTQRTSSRTSSVPFFPLRGESSLSPQRSSSSSDRSARKAAEHLRRQAGEAGEFQLRRRFLLSLDISPSTPSRVSRLLKSDGDRLFDRYRRIRRRAGPYAS